MGYAKYFEDINLKGDRFSGGCSVTKKDYNEGIKDYRKFPREWWVAVGRLMPPGVEPWTWLRENGFL